jgi:peroxiredoxin
LSSSAGPWLIAVAVGAAVLFALWTGESTPDPIGRGSRAPDFTLPVVSDAADAGSVSLSDLRGRVVLLNFWASWCKPCEDEMPAMERLYRSLGPEGLQLLAVSVDEARPQVDAFRRRLDLTFPILLDADKDVSLLYQTYRYPETLLIDRDGTVVERYIGPREWDAELYQARIRRLLEPSRG